jgi:hypothetical protein
MTLRECPERYLTVLGKNNFWGEKMVEFRYPSRMKKWFVLPLSVLVVITLFYLFNILLDALQNQLTLYQLISDILFPIAPTVITIVVYFRYLSKVSNDVIILDEKGIRQRRNREIITISWADVIKVEWGNKKSTDGLSCNNRNRK